MVVNKILPMVRQVKVGEQDQAAAKQRKRIIQGVSRGWTPPHIDQAPNGAREKVCRPSRAHTLLLSFGPRAHALGYFLPPCRADSPARPLLDAPWHQATRLATVVVLIWGLVTANFSQVVLRSDLVLVPVTVHDKQGKYVTDLRVEDFTLFDNGQPQPIAFFSSEQDSERIARPLALTLLLDASRSISAVLHQQRSAVTSLLNRLGERTLVSLISFSQSQETLLGFTADKTEALNAFFRHQRIGGNTAIFDALSFALKNFNALSEGGMRKIVVIISDGLDTASQINYRECVRLAEEQGIAVYSILIPIYSPYGDRLIARRPTKGFVEIAEETGGKFFQVGTVEEALHPSAKLDLGPVFEAIVEDLRHQYYLGFYPPESNQPGFHRLEVRVGRKNMKLELRRRGYTVQTTGSR